MKKEFSLENKIIDYCRSRSNNDIARFFRAHFDRTAETLAKRGLRRHSKEENAKLWKRAQRARDLEKHDASYFSQMAEWARKARKRYFADNLYFDSLPGLAFYLWYKRNGIEIERSPKNSNMNSKARPITIFHDFEVDWKLYEVKGSQFLSEDGKLKSPYEDDHGKYEAKGNVHCEMKPSFYMKTAIKNT